MKKFSYEEVLEASTEYFGDDLSAAAFTDKYALVDDDKNYYEKTPDDMHRRLAKELAKEEDKFPNPLSEEEIYSDLKGFKYIIPQGSPMSAIGNPFKVMSLGNCFVKGTHVITNSGPKNIEDVKVGDLVPTHKGRLRAVSQLHKNKLDGRVLYNIKCFRTPSFKVTENHALWSISKEQLEWGSKPGWNEVSYLRKGDWVAIPNLKQNTQTSYKIDLFCDIFKNENYGPSKKAYYEYDVSDDKLTFITVKKDSKFKKEHFKVNRFWEINEDFAFFLGLWYGDGCVFNADKNTKRIKGISFTFGKHEEGLIGFVANYGKKLFGLEPDINYNNANKDSTVQIIFYSAAIGLAFIELFGRGCSGKKMYSNIYNWNTECVNKLLGGLISSDGTVTKSGDVRVVLKNKNLIKDFYSLARTRNIAVGYSATLIGEMARLDFPKRSSILKYVDKTYSDDRIEIAKRKGECALNIKTIDGINFVKISGKKEAFTNDNYVYTLGVEEDHSYCVEGIICQNCYVIPSVIDSYGGILRADEQLAQLMKRRAGVGLDISNIRPKGMPTKNAAKTTDGIGIFMERFSNTCREVAQKGRRGAEMQSISIHHPEVSTFINIKKDLTKVTGANISVRLTDEFMNAVKNDTDYEQRWPVEGTPQISKMVSARSIWKEIIHSAWASAEPGVLFWDTILKNSPADVYGSVNPDFITRSTNPCFHGDERFLTETGYIKFRDSVDLKLRYPVDRFPGTKLITDNKITYEEKSKDNISENWEIDINKKETSVREVEGAAFITKEYSELLELDFSNGQKLKCTPDHHIATTDGMVEAQDLSPDHSILVSIPKPPEHNIIDQLPSNTDERCAFLMGLIAGDGTFTKKYGMVHVDIWGPDKERMADLVHSMINSLYKKESLNKDLLDSRWKTRKMSPYCTTVTEDLDKIRISSTWLGHLLNQRFGFSRKTKQVVPEFIINRARTKTALYYLSGLYYADGTVSNIVKKGISIRLAQSNKKFLRDVQLLTHANGIATRIFLRKKDPVNVIKGIAYKCKDHYELITVCGGWKAFSNIISINHPEKDERINNLRSLVKKDYYKNDLTQLVSVKKIEGDTVYCITEKTTHSIIVNTISTRQCGEIAMGIDSCRLLVVNLFSFVKNPFTDDSFFDFKHYAQVVQRAQRLMDDIVEMELSHIQKIIDKIEADPEDEDIKSVELNLWKRFKRNCELGRRTGLGITALGDALAALGIQYGSNASIEMTDNIYRELAVNAFKSSAILAKERGAFPLYNSELELNHPFIQKVLSQDNELKELHSIYGRRNIALTTTAPTGTVSTQTQTTSGIEPAFSLEYWRYKKVNPGDENVTVDRVDGMGDAWQKFKQIHKPFKLWQEISGKTNAEDSPYHEATANDINWLASVEIQAAAQAWICHSISKTANIHEESTEELVSDIYMKAWETGCKGFTIYRDKCRDGVLVHAEESSKENSGEKWTAIKRPTKLLSETTKIKLDTGEGLNNAYITVSFAPDSNDLYEVFVNTPIVNTSVDDNLKDLQILELATRMTSLALRHGINPKFVINQLMKVNGQYIHSIPVNLAKVLMSYDKVKEESLGSKCPKCGVKSYVFTDGCGKCLECGHSGCS